MFLDQRCGLINIEVLLEKNKLKASKSRKRFSCLLNLILLSLSWFFQNFKCSTSHSIGAEILN